MHILLQQCDYKHLQIIPVKIMVALWCMPHAARGLGAGQRHCRHAHALHIQEGGGYSLAQQPSSVRAMVQNSTHSCSLGARPYFREKLRSGITPIAKLCKVGRVNASACERRIAGNRRELFQSSNILVLMLRYHRYSILHMGIIDTLDYV